VQTDLGPKTAHLGYHEFRQTRVLCFEIILLLELMFTGAFAMHSSPAVANHLYTLSNKTGSEARMRRTYLALLNRYNLRINTRKCFFGYKAVLVLGHVLSPTTKSADMNKISALESASEQVLFYAYNILVHSLSSKFHPPHPQRSSRTSARGIQEGGVPFYGQLQLGTLPCSTGIS